MKKFFFFFFFPLSMSWKGKSIEFLENPEKKTLFIWDVQASDQPICPKEIAFWGFFAFTKKILFIHNVREQAQNFSIWRKINFSFVSGESLFRKQLLTSSSKASIFMRKQTLHAAIRWRRAQPDDNNHVN